MTMKVGMQGRVDPRARRAARAGRRAAALRGGAGRRRAEDRSSTKLERVPVTVPPGDANVLFTHVEEDMEFPMPPRRRYRRLRRLCRLRSGAAPEPKRKPAPRRRQPTRRRSAGRSSRDLDYQPRSATTVLLSARMSAITARAPALVSCAPRLGAGVAAADEADRHHAGGVRPRRRRPANPRPRCSRPAATRILAAACRNRSGAGLPCGTSLAENRYGSKKRIRSVVSRLTRTRSSGDEEATHFGPRSQVSA